MSIRIVSRGILRRSFEVSGDEESFLLTYSGRMPGKEAIFIDGNEIASGPSLYWFVPSFEFEFEAKKYIVEVRLWPWFAFMSFLIQQNGQTVYSEGFEPYKVSPITELTQIVSFFVLVAAIFAVFFSIIIWLK